jgi:2-polyprenyl-3-methyl-5-hydroxy-6-metoxy-1,4-benzoquinol methylase
MLQFLPSTYSTVLEVGCAEGTFSRHLNASERWGVESDAESARIAGNALNRVLRGSYDVVAADIPDEYFDIVICNDVIEHMRDHDWFFKSIYRKIRKQGFLIGSIPNVRHIRNLFELLILKDWRYREIGILDRTHLRFFTEKSLIRSLTESEFIIEQFNGINKSRGIFPNILMGTISIASLGYYSDIGYLQFGFRARKA